MIVLSSNHYSHDDQVADAVSYLSNSDEHRALMDGPFLEAFPEYNNLTWSGAWVDCEASGVDPDYMSWVTDWLENNTPVVWNDGEPVIYEASDWAIVSTQNGYEVVMPWGDVERYDDFSTAQADYPGARMGLD